MYSSSPTVPERRREERTQQYIVLDDDPIGVQTVHDCLLLTAWDSASLRAGFDDAEWFFYVVIETGARRAEETERIVTELAKDSVFGYTTSYLPGYIAEKTSGTEVPVDRDDVVTVSLQDLRRGTVKTLVKRLAELTSRTHVAVDAENYEDLDVFTEAVRTVLGTGKRFVFQTAASFVKSVTSNPDQPLQTRFPGRTQRSGMVMVGSHVPKTTAQLEFLLCESNDRTVETEAVGIDVHRLLKDPDAERKRSAETVSSTLRKGRTPVVYTSREVLKFDSQEEQLSAGTQISRTLSGIVSDLDEEPRFIIAKGGITFYDVLVHGLHVSEVRVKGQVLPGIPVVVMPEGHRFADMPCVIFPGNVGDTDTLVTAFEKLTQTGDAGDGQRA